MLSVSEQVGQTYKFGLHPRPTVIKEPLPSKDVIFAWRARLRLEARERWKAASAAMNAAEAASRHVPLPLSQLEAAGRAVAESVLVDMMCGYLPPIRGACLRTLQV